MAHPPAAPTAVPSYLNSQKEISPAADAPLSRALTPVTLRRRLVEAELVPFWKAPPPSSPGRPPRPLDAPLR